jgi:hypothetical protein
MVVMTTESLAGRGASSGGVPGSADQAAPESAGYQEDANLLYRDGGAGALASGISGGILAVQAAGPTAAQHDLAHEGPPGTSTQTGKDHTLPVDLDSLADQVLTRIKRQLALDHERAGGFLSDLMQ